MKGACRFILKKFIIASNNPKKIKELDRILNPLGITAVTAKQEGITLPEVEETGTTFAENARLKALSAFKATGMPSIADDSGLMVDALNGRPGVYSARYGGENATDAQKNEKLLSELINVKKEDRKACFASAICCIIDMDNIIEVYGECKGEIAFAPKGDGGFGYDPVFLVPDGRSYAQLTAQEKDGISHRGNALRALRAELIKYYGCN